MRQSHPLAHRLVPPLSPVLLAGLALRPLPPALFQPVPGLAGGTPFSNGFYYGVKGVAFRDPPSGASPPASVSRV